MESTTFRQACPSCGRELELPSEADGQTAACPACAHQFIASDPASRGFPGESSDESARDETRVEGGSELAGQTSEGLESTAEATEHRPTRRLSEQDIQSLPVETILADARYTFLCRRRPLLIPFLFPSVLMALLVFAPIAYLSELANRTFSLAMIWLGWAHAGVPRRDRVCVLVRNDPL